MAKCDVCQKPLNREESEIGSWCIDCIRSMSNTNTSNMKAQQESRKKERKIMLIISAILAVIGVFFIIAIAKHVDDYMLGIFLDIWIACGLGAGIYLFIDTLKNLFKLSKSRGGSFVESFKYAILPSCLFLVLGCFGGIIFFLIIILRRNNWIKKFDAIIASEDAAIAELQDYTLGKNIDKADLSRKIGIIANNFELAKDGVCLDDLKVLKIVK
ncbi:hypothetical protein [Treponema sp. R80B11-R83G3]